MSFDGRAIANHILDYFDTRGMPVTHLALQKLIYFCHVWSLVKLDRPLVKHGFEAWEYGPVLPYLYREFHSEGDKPIKKRAKRLDLELGRAEVATCELDETLRDLLANVLSFYGQLSTGTLVDMSHAAGGPWERVWNHSGRINPGMQIRDDAIKSYYSTMKLPFTLQ